MTDRNRRSVWTGTLLAAALLAVCGANAWAADPAPAAGTDWPRFRGPNGDSLVPNSPKLLDTWPKNGPPLVWKSDPLPFAPTCGVGNPVVAGGKVYTYAQVALPIDGVKPFSDEFLAHWGWTGALPADLVKKVEAAISDPKRKACKSKDEVAAYCKEFLATLDPAQAKQFGDSILTRMQGGGFGNGDLDWMGSLKDKEIKSRQEFANLFIDRFHHNIYHGGQADYIFKHADEAYKAQKWADQIICLDAATGKSLWTKEFPGVKKSWGVEFGCSGTPTIIADRMYLAGSGGIYCLDLKKNGELIWQGKGEASHASPVISEGVVYCCPGDLAAFDAETGKLLWRQPTVIHDSTTPLVWKDKGKTYVLCASAAPRYYSNLYCVDAADGKIVWREPLQGGYGALALSGDTLVVRGGGCTAYKLSALKPEQLWTSKEGGDYGGSPIIYQDHVYSCGRAYSGDLETVFDLKTGAMTLHQVGKGGACSTGLIADGKILFLCESNYKTSRLISFKTAPDKYEEVGQLPNADMVACTSPAFADGKVYVRMPTAIACYDLRAEGK